MTNQTYVDDLRTSASKHLIPHFTKSKDWAANRWPIIVEGDGCFVFDDQGRKYLDGLSGLFCVNLGYGRDDLVAAAANQMKKLSFAPNWKEAHPSAIEASASIAAVTPGDLNRTFFVNSGSEAVEAAIKFARQYFWANGEPWRRRIITRHLAYHGTTMGALSATALPRIKRPFEPMLDGFSHISNSMALTGVDDPVLVEEHLRLLEEEIIVLDPSSIALLIAEPIQNSGGAITPPAGYWSGLRRLCDKYGILLLADEVITGFGRLGSFFGVESMGVIPDMVTFAKGATSGYVPLGGLIVRDALASKLFEAAPSFTHGSTFGAHPVATAVLNANVAAISNEGILDNVKDLQNLLSKELTRLRENHICAYQLRGSGFLWALELAADSENMRPFTPSQSEEVLGEVVPAALDEAGLIVRPDDRGGTMLVISPPLVANEEIIGQLCERLDTVLSKVDRFCESLSKRKEG
ncbi:MAG: aminotransferase class III-fold pyridoxal phosphate-dependent enzyme [Actinomycetota bacterium]|nr:aminotransferase class III-fold pyridoxal phosphate-dependent enzyme [Actinomycetota bacterium]